MKVYRIIRLKWGFNAILVMINHSSYSRSTGTFCSLMRVFMLNRVVMKVRVLWLTGSMRSLESKGLSVLDRVFVKLEPFYDGIESLRDMEGYKDNLGVIRGIIMVIISTNTLFSPKKLMHPKR